MALYFTIIIIALIAGISTCICSYIGYLGDRENILLRDRVRALEDKVEGDILWNDIVRCRQELFHKSAIVNYTVNPNKTINVVLDNGHTINTMYTDIDELTTDLFGVDTNITDLT